MSTTPEFPQPEVEIGLPIPIGPYSVSHKFRIGQTVFIMQDNKVETFEVQTIEIRLMKDIETIVYSIHDSDFPWVPESNCFATKEELLARL